MKVNAAVYSSGNGDTTDLRIYVKLCTSGSHCKFSTAESEGVGENITQLEVTRDVQYEAEDFSEEVLDYTLAYSGEFVHDSSSCKGTDSCRYAFSVYNPSSFSTPRQTTLHVEAITESIQEITPSETFKNIVNQERYVYYKIVNQLFDLDKAYQVRIDLNTYLGDADLFVSTDEANKRPSADSHTYQSRSKNFYD